jgi:hypothetical protein
MPSPTWHPLRRPNGEARFGGGCNLRCLARDRCEEGGERRRVEIPEVHREIHAPGNHVARVRRGDHPTIRCDLPPGHRAVGGGASAWSSSAIADTHLP